MPQTPLYALPYPAQSDPADVPLDIQELAERVEVALPLMPAVRVYNGGGQTLASGAPAAFPSERFDQIAGAASTQHDPSTNNTRLTCRQAGIYLIGGWLQWVNVTTGEYRQLRLRLNGTTTIAVTTQARTATSGFAEITLETIYQLAVNDYVELVAGHDIAPNASIAPGSEFWMARVA